MANQPVVLMQLPSLVAIPVETANKAWAIIGRTPLTESQATHVIHLAELAAKVLAEMAEKQANQSPEPSSRH